MKIKKIKKFIFDNWSLILSLTIILSLSGLIFIPVLKIKFGWIDDGWDTIVSKNLISSLTKLDFADLSNVLIERSMGLFRPVHWFWQAFVYIISGNSSFIQHLMHSIIVIGTSLLIFFIVKNISKSNFAALVGASLFLVVPVNIENWVRMGPQEPLMGFLFTISLYVLFRYKKVYLALLFLLLAFLTKETAISIVPAVLAYYLIQRYYFKKDQILLKYLVGSIIISVVVMFIVFSIRTGYATNYEFNITNSIYRFGLLVDIVQTAFPLGVIFLITFVLRNICSVMNNKIKKIDQSNFDELFFLMMFISFLVVQSPWIYVLTRYLLPITIPGVIFLGIELANLQKFLNIKYRKIYIVVAILFVGYYSIYLTGNVIKARGLVTWWIHYTTEIQLMFKYIAENTPYNGAVYINYKKGEATLEPIAETGWNLALYYNRSDIRVKSIEDKPVNEKNYIVVSSPTFLDPSVHFSETELLNNKNLIKTDSLRETDKYIVFSNVETIVRQIAKKSLGLILHHQRITPDGIYTYYLLSDQWNFYYFK